MSDLSPSLPAPEPSRNGRPHGIPVFLLALLIGLGLHLAVLCFFRLEIPAPHTVPTPLPAIRYTTLSPADDLSDPEQIYLSGTHNFSSQPVKHSVAQPPQVSADIPVEVNHQPGDFHLFTSLPDAPKSPTAALEPAKLDYLNTLGLAPTSVDALPSRGAIVHITRQAATGTSRTSIPDIIWLDKVASAGDAQWSPTSFTLIFNSTGLVGQPMLQQSKAGNEKVEEELRNRLRDWFLHHPALPPGYYNAEIAP